MSKYEIRRLDARMEKSYWWQVIDVPCNRIVLKSSYYFDRGRRNRESLEFSKASGIPIAKK